MSTICTSSRLHFGLLSLGGMGTRRFGGVGLMVEEPAVQVRVTPASHWSAEGPSAARALAFARAWRQAVQHDGAFHVVVEKCPPEHVGLGTGTQLGLATARALAEAWGHRNPDPLELARHIDRGRRSALGIHGFARGGFLVEGGKGDLTIVAPLLVRVDFPDDWRILLVMPQDLRGAHGVQEARVFDGLTGVTKAREVDALCRLVLLGLLPALQERDLPAFGEALYEFNHGVGEMFQAFQGGVYANPRSAEIVHCLRNHGVRGVGQSSWGPTVFAILDADEAMVVAKFLRQRLGLQSCEVICSRAQNQGARAVEQ